MTKIAINNGRSLRILFAFKPEGLLKGETRKRRDLFPRGKDFFLDRTPLTHGSFHRAFLSAGGDLERAATRTQLSLIGEDGRRRLTEWRVGLKQEVFGE
jgi:hypothetical protein